MGDWTTLISTAKEVVDKTVASLPDEIKVLAERIPLSFEGAPSKEIQSEGVAEDTLGLFVGEAHDDFGEGAPLPGQILLFLDNIWDFAEGDMEAYQEEIRVTFLHELGHYLGWDEHDLFERDLD